MRISHFLPIAAALAVIAIEPSSPAAAKQMNSCLLRHTNCTERCIMKEETKTSDQATACIKRTCDHQFKACSGGTTTAGEELDKLRRKRVVRDKRTPRRGADSTTPISQPTPMAQPRPATTGNGSTTAGQPAVRDHRRSRAGSTGSSVTRR